MQHDKKFCSPIVTQRRCDRQLFQLTQVTLRNPCGCGSSSGRLGAGRKPKELSLACSECKKFIAWLPANQLKKLVDQGGEV
jgi:hypothetical protein